MSVKPSVITDFSQFTQLRAEARNHDPEAVRKAAQQFEALFTQQLLKAAHSTPLGPDLLGGNGDTYRDMFDQQMAMHMASGKGLGLADMLVRQLQLGQKSDGGASADSAAPAGHLPAKAGIPLDLARAAAAVNGGAGLRAQGAAANASAAPAALRAVAPAPHTPPLRDAINAAGTAPADDGLAGLKAFSSPQEFVAALRPHAEAAARELGIPSKVLIAQAALETGWGRHLMRKSDGSAALNFFGIKADTRWDGERARHATREFENGQMQSQTAEFRSYASIGESFADYVRFLKTNPRYAQALQHGGSAAHFAAGLQKAGYATDPGYATKLLRLANGPTLSVALAEPPATRLA